ncbi:unnamed protein product [Rotaria magnacalcarata]
MEPDRIGKAPRFYLPLMCKICGDVARGFNFDVITCLSCKAFFRRNAFRLSSIRCCQRKNCCKITKETRSYCPACRLKKCYAFGMNSNLIQSVSKRETSSHVSKESMIEKQTKIQLSTPRPIGLLQNDSSMLSHDQWNLLSNIIRSYDKQNVIKEVRCILESKSSLPAKLRLKPADTIDLMSKPLENIVLLMGNSPHFCALSSNAHRAVVSHNLILTGGLDGYFVARETDQLNNIHYMIASGALYGSDFMAQCAKDNERLEPNGNLIKIMLFVLIFSSNCSVVVFNGQEDINIMSSTSELIHIQDIYLAILWKYLIYLYGYNQAIVHFSAMVKSVLDMLRRVEDLSKNDTLERIITRVVTHAERSLVIED